MKKGRMTLTRTVFYPGDGYRLEVHEVTPEDFRAFLRTIDTRPGPGRVMHPRSTKVNQEGRDR